MGDALQRKLHFPSFTPVLFHIFFSFSPRAHHLRYTQTARGEEMKEVFLGLVCFSWYPTIPVPQRSLWGISVDIESWETWGILFCGDNIKELLLYISYENRHCARIWGLPLGAHVFLWICNNRCRSLPVRLWLNNKHYIYSKLSSTICLYTSHYVNLYLTMHLEFWTINLKKIAYLAKK
jgi:hypothetical protein